VFTTRTGARSFSTSCWRYYCLRSVSVRLTSLPFRRLRDIPGREFPELPDEVAKALQGLWNTALDSAYAAIDGKAATRDATLAQREASIAVRETQLVEPQETAAARTTALEDSLALAREQLTAHQQPMSLIQSANLASRSCYYSECV
jgi:hypothetical protein